MTLRVGNYATWIDTSAGGCIRSGFFQGLDGGRRLVFATPNGLYAVDSGKTLHDADKNLYTLVEYKGPLLQVFRDGHTGPVSKIP